MSVLASDGVQQRSQADSVSIGVHIVGPLYLLISTRGRHQFYLLLLHLFST